ncbi:unnamed protein product [Prorocentrum cordatum]|uniref:FHA domain-containing protein n=1 Tax=Prorocentrum cordatum TaxID=2364126 RepID=A0ABN9WZ47_9DINO|nr:unnamed protein product [Polarella glacialis]
MLWRPAWRACRPPPRASRCPSTCIRGGGGPAGARGAASHPGSAARGGAGGSPAPAAAEAAAMQRRATYLLWQIPTDCDGQGLSDRRACLAVILAEAFLLERVAVLPLFRLDADRHNAGVLLPGSDLSEYVSLERIPVATVALADFAWEPGEAAVVAGPVRPREWRGCRARVLVRPCTPGFWRNELAGELHGTGMRPTAGLFAAPARVAAAAARAAARIGAPYVGVHVRRGDKLSLMPWLEAATRGEAVARAVASLAPPGVGHVYVASNDAEVDYAGALRAEGFRCSRPQDVFAEEVGRNNHLLFAMEMKLVDDAVVCIRTFNDSTPWYFSAVRKPSYHLVDRGMHDYLAGSTCMGTNRCDIKSAIAMDTLTAQEASSTLEQAAAAGLSSGFLPVEGLPRMPCPESQASRVAYSVAVFSQVSTVADATLWAMSGDGQGVYSASLPVALAGHRFVVAVDGDRRRCLFPDAVGTWPLLQEAVIGPGAPRSPECAWPFPEAPGIFAVRLETCGRRLVSVAKEPASGFGRRNAAREEKESSAIAQRAGHFPAECQNCTPALHTLAKAPFPVPGKGPVGERNAECDVVVAHASVSARHCALTSTGGGPVQLRDLGSTNGTFLGGARVAGEEGAAARGARHFPTPEWKRARAAAAAADAGNAPAQGDPGEATAVAGAAALGAGRWCLVNESTEDVVEIVPGTPLTLGSGGGCDVVVEGRGVREEHCMIRDAVPRRLRRKTAAPPPPPSGQAAAVELLDLGSAGGTLLNGTRLARGGSAPLQAGDVVALASPGGPRLRVRGPRASGEEQAGAGASGTKRPLVDAGATGAAAPRQPRCEGPADAVVAPQAGDRAADAECADPSAGEPGSGTCVEDVAAAVAEAVRESGAGAGAPRLVDLTSGKRHDLIPTRITTVGRKGDCEVLVDSPWVSGRHCLLFCGSDGSVELEDLSTNGTWINDTRVPKGALLPQRVQLNQGDSLALGRSDRPAFLVLLPVQAESLRAAGA